MTNIFRFIFWFILGWIAYHYAAFWLGRLLGIFLPVYDSSKRQGEGGW